MRYLHVLLALCITAVLSAQDFDTYFEEGVLRLDIMITGNATDADYTLAGMKKEAYYSGSKTNLLDNSGYGDHMFKVTDSKSGEEIFSYTNCTLFREWQTTMEARTVNRAFSHVVRFPYPKEKVKVEIFNRDENGEFVARWSEVIDPESMFIDPGNHLEFESFDLEINGPPEKKVDLLFIAEGYAADEMDKFIEDAKRSAEYIFSEEPFTSQRKNFNVRAVKSVSQESGVDIPGQGIWKNSVVNANFYTFGIERYMTTIDYKSVCDVAANAHYDQIYILVNTDKYGGGGIYNYYSISAADNASSRAVVIHEFGHAFGGLGDEYYNSSVAYNDFYPLDREPWEPNLTTMVDFGSKWKDMLKKKTPVPTPAEDMYAETVGVYEGGGYMAKGIFRPMINCRMHTNHAVFCPVCSKALVEMIEKYCE